MEHPANLCLLDGWNTVSLLKTSIRSWSLLIGEEENHRISWTTAASSLTASLHVHSFTIEPLYPHGVLTLPPPSGLVDPDPSLLRLQRSCLHQSSLPASLNEPSTGWTPVQQLNAESLNQEAYSKRPALGIKEKPFRCTKGCLISSEI